MSSFFHFFLFPFYYKFGGFPHPIFVPKRNPQWGGPTSASRPPPERAAGAQNFPWEEKFTPTSPNMGRGTVGFKTEEKSRPKYPRGVTSGEPKHQKSSLHRALA
ncbi:hypothetical protein JTE90_029196 [Oedothorax gibbosus]|uniref:Uncharacterized protein n=1 Tax=Oedothorax gibbosus TaxID=931172 RepID=A0AAV6TPY6_9ARAC|nr:hypothetical protein JTE90_029196 [Oedothorax gibbosus]